MAVRIIVLVLYFAVLLAIGVYTSKMAKFGIQSGGQEQ